MTPLRDGPHAEDTAAVLPAGNTALRGALDRAGWTPRDLVRALNPRLDAAGQPRLHLTAAHVWLRGAQPRGVTVRRLVATVLGEAAGQPLTAADLWPSAPRAARREPTAIDALTGRLPLLEVLATATTWSRATPQDQAALQPAGDDRLFAAAWDAAHQTTATLPPARGPDQVLPPLMDLLERQLADLRRLDDSAGGGTLSQRYVHSALAAVLDLIRHSDYTPDIGHRLLRNAAGLAQLAGWMGFDAGLAPAAHRHQLLAIRLARAAGDAETVANALGMLAYQHAAAHRPAAALRFAAAAVDHAARSAPTVRARAAGRLATAHAAAGDLEGFRAAADTCRALLGHRRPDDPDSLYYLTQHQVDAETGAALVDLARAHPSRGRRLLAEATDLLAPLAEQGPRGGYLRSAVLHGAHLARAHLLTRDATAATATLTQLAGHIPHVQSIRCRQLVEHLGRHAGRHLRGPDRIDALEAVRAALSTA